MEVRRLWVDLDDADWIRETLNLSGCRIALRIDREVRTRKGDVVSCDVRYFVSSLCPERTTAKTLLRHARGHWQVENGLHFVKDRWWDEDRHATRRPGLSAAMAALTTLAVSIHRLRSDPKRPLRASADRIAWTPAHGLRLLTD